VAGMPGWVVNIASFQSINNAQEMLESIERFHHFQTFVTTHGLERRKYIEFAQVFTLRREQPEKPCRICVQR